MRAVPAALCRSSRSNENLTARAPTPCRSIGTRPFRHVSEVPQPDAPRRRCSMAHHRSARGLKCAGMAVMNASIPRNWTDGNVARVRLVSRARCTGPPSRNIEYQPDRYKKRPWQGATLQPRAAEGNGSSPPSRIRELRRFSATRVPEGARSLPAEGRRCQLVAAVRCGGSQAHDGKGQRRPGSAGISNRLVQPGERDRLCLALLLAHQPRDERVF
jgi:hypothetical protein